MRTLQDATLETCGGKATTLGLLLRAGLPVPEGFAVPFAARRAPGPGATRHVAGRHDPGARDAAAPSGGGTPDAFADEVASALAEMGDPIVAVRSSAADEDAAGASAAGQYESVLAVRGAGAVIDAIRSCWRAAASDRVATYRSRRAGGEAAAAEMAVLVQRLVDAEASGVIFTPARPGDPARIEASWGLGPGVVGGTLTPDGYEVERDGSVRCSVGRKATRLDRAPGGSGVVTSAVPMAEQCAPVLDDAVAVRVARLGGRVAALLGSPQDIEWALADDTVWILQARPVTAPPPRVPDEPRGGEAPDGAELRGAPGSHGVVVGPARVVRGPSDFARVRSGDIVVCPHTDPAWTPLLAVAAGVVTGAGGVLSHAAIVAREYGIPAVLGVPEATTRIVDGTRIAVDGTAGTVVQR